MNADTGDKLRIAVPHHEPTAVPLPPETTVLPDSEVYRTVALRYRPEWRSMIGVAPWLELDHPIGVKGGIRIRDLAGRIAAATALGFCEGAETEGVSPALIREQVRATLALWQSHLTGAGKLRACRDHPLAVRMASHVVHLLCDIDGYAESFLLGDVSRHLDWLARQPARDGCCEASLVVALADGAVLLRRTELLRYARQRLHELLLRQTDEGWFPERGGADVGRLTLAVDSLARVYHHHDWDELTEPLARSLRFLRHFVTPTGLTATCGEPFGTGLLSPYGVEILAATHPDAYALAVILRHRYAKLAQTKEASWSSEAALRIGPAALLAARCGSATLRGPTFEPIPSERLTRFTRADVAIVETPHYRAIISPRHGGAVWVWWSRLNSLTQDSGLCVVFPHHTRVSGNVDRSNRSSTTPTTITCHGVLRRLRTGERPRSSCWRWFRKAVRLRGGDTLRQPPLTGTKPLTKAQHRALLHDHFRRDVTFHEDRIEIRDEVICRMKCEAIVCGSMIDPNTVAATDATSCEQPGDAPIYLRGGKHAVITRVYQNGALRECRQQGLD